MIYTWLYFAQYALIFDGKHSWHALLFSRDLMRKRFFKVAMRIVVFLAVWSGFNSWAAGAFVVVSLLFGPVGVVTGFLGTTIFLVGLAEIGVNFATTAFLVAAGLRLYQDLRERHVEAVRFDSGARLRCNRRRNCRKRLFPGSYLSARLFPSLRGKGLGVRSLCSLAIPF